MSITTERKNLNLNKACIRENINSWIEQDIIVPDTKPDAIKIVNVNVSAYISDCEVMDDKVKVSGKLNYYVIYKCNETDMGTRGLFTTFPYTQVLSVKGARKNMNACVMPMVRNVIYSLPNERKIATKTEVSFKVELHSPASVSLISKFETDEDIECKMVYDKFNNILKIKKSIIVSKEEIMLPKENEDFFEILKVNTAIKNTEYKGSYNKIMVKGDLELKMLYLAVTKEEQVKNLTMTVPFTGMIELDGISDKSNFDIKYILQDFNIRPNLEITSTKTLITEFQIEVNVKMYEKMEVEYVSDFYSQSRELVYENEIINVVKGENTITKAIDLKDTVSNIVSGDNRVIEYSVDTNYIVPRVVGNTVHVEGNAKVSFIIVNEDSEVENKVVDILVNEEYTLEEITASSKVDVNLSIDRANMMQNGSDVDLTIRINVDIVIEDVVELNIIDKITDNKLNLVNLDSMNIYIIKPNDTLWTVAKKYKTSVDKIVKINDITNPEKIDVGQKILIIR
ncbi:MAG: DUF3794 domain-containing protein [Clostridia bacterium]|nr:DUF3794 domain-containing protein [Clostridia bacterium]